LANAFNLHPSLAHSSILKLDAWAEAPAIIRDAGRVEEISQSFHPVRWAALVTVSLPLLLLLTAGIASVTAHIDAARALMRLVRYVLGLELAVVLLLAFTGYRYERRACRRDRELYPPPGRRIDIGGYRLHILCGGTGGPTVVLEYGLGASYLDWRLVEPQIAGFTRVCVYDRAGYGWSDPSPRRRVPSVMADELHSLLHAAGEKAPYLLVAHSFASGNAVMFAHKFPQEVLGLVLVDGMHTLSDFPFPLRRRISLLGTEALIPFGLPRWRGWCGGAGPRDLRGVRQAISCRRTLFRTFYRENESLSANAEEVRSITTLGRVPLIVIARDPSIPYAGERARWELIQKQKLALSTNRELIIATGSGHDIPLTRPDLIIAAVKKLEAQSPSTGGHPGNS
jgi:pimeloyl-ACP methyl ester carboxylesterase